MDKQEIIEIVKKHIETDVEITEDSRLFADLGLSSLGVFALLCDLENKLGKQFDIMDFVGLKTIGELITKINK